MNCFAQKIYFLLLILFTGSAYSQGNQQYIDSLKQTLLRPEADTNRAISLFRLCWDLRKSDPVQAELYGKEALKLSTQLNFIRGIGASYNNIGGVYEVKGEEWKALQFYLKALDVKRKGGDKKSIASTLNNIGIIYKKQEDYANAVAYYKEALRINLEAGNTNFIILNLQNLAGMYKASGNADSAYYFIEQSIEACRKANKEELLIDLFQTKGNIFLIKGEFRKAITYYDSSLYESMKFGAKGPDYFYYSNKGRALLYLNEMDTSGIFLEKAWELKRNTSEWESRESVTEGLSEYYRQKYLQSGNKEFLEKSLEFFRIRYNSRDSLINFKKRKSISDLITQDLISRKNEELTAMQREKDIVDLQAKNEHLFVYMLIIIVLAIGVVTLVIWLRFRKNKILSKQLAHKNKEILDSIHYAKRIQKSLLPSEKYIERVLKKK